MRTIVTEQLGVHIVAFETFGRSWDEALSLNHDLVGKAAEIIQLSFSRLLSH